MKTLKESLLDNIETSMTNGDQMIKDFENEKKEFLKAIGAAKNYEGSYSLKDGRVNKVFTPNVLK